MTGIRSAFRDSSVRRLLISPVILHVPVELVGERVFGDAAVVAETAQPPVAEPGSPSR